MKAKKICAGAMALVLSMGTMSAFTGCGSSTDSSSKGCYTWKYRRLISKTHSTQRVQNWKFFTNRTDRKEDGKLDALTDKV